MIYFILFLYEAVVCYFYDVRRLNEKRMLEMHDYKLKIYVHKGVISLAIIIPLWFVMGLRYRIGADYTNYENVFLQSVLYKENSSHIELGYYFLNRFAGSLSDNPQIIFFLVAFLIIFFCFKGIEKNEGSMYCGILAFMGLGYYFYAMNIQRQYIAVMIAFYSFKYLEQRNLKKFVISILTASLFHLSAIIWIVIYMCIYVFKKRYYAGTLVIMAAMVIFKNTVLDIMVRMNFYDHQIQYVRNLIGEDDISLVNVLISSVFLLGCVVWHRPLIRIRQENVIRIKLLWLLLLTDMFLWQFGGAVSRIRVYLCPVYFLLLSDIVQCIPIKEKRTLKIILGVVLLCFMQIIIHYSGNAGNHFLPYRFRSL